MSHGLVRNKMKKQLVLQRLQHGFLHVLISGWKTSSGNVCSAMICATQCSVFIILFIHQRIRGFYGAHLVQILTITAVDLHRRMAFCVVQSFRIGKN